LAFAKEATVIQGNQTHFRLSLPKTPKGRESIEFFATQSYRHRHAHASVYLVSFRVRSRGSLELELVALQHQVTVLRRQRPSQPRLFAADRLLWVWLYRIWPKVLDAMVLVKPATVIDWPRKGFRLYWRRRSRHLGRPGMNREVRKLIRQMSQANPLWGAPRIHGKLLKLGIELSQATVGRHLVAAQGPLPDLALVPAQPHA
jgi:putative transposase